MAYIGILSLDTIIIPKTIRRSMSQHAVRTAMTLYQNGTLDLTTAARQAGISPDRLSRSVDRLGGATTTARTDPEPVAVRAD